MKEGENKYISLDPILKCAVFPKTVRKCSIRNHQHFDYELIYLIKGTYEYQHNDIHNALKPGCGFLIRPGDWHTDFLSKGTEYIAVNFVFRDNDSSILSEISDERLLYFKDRNRLLKNILLKLLAENSSADAFSFCLQKAYLLEMYWQTLRLLPRQVIPEELLEDEEKIRFQKALRSVFLENIYKFPSLKLLASRLYLSPRTLNNHCRDILGMSPVKAFMKVKMDYSLELITRTGMSIKEISVYLGFQNQYHFSKAFKRFFNYSPSFIRKKRKRLK